MSEDQRKKIKIFLAQKYRLVGKKIIPLNGGVQNSNFLIKADHGQFVFRIYNRKSKKDLAYAIHILLKLRQSNFPSPELLTVNNNHWVSLLENLPCLLYKYLPGKTIVSKSACLVKQLGALQGRMHRLLREEKDHDQKPNWDVDGLNKIIRQNKPLLEFEYPDKKKEIKYIIDQIKLFSTFDKLPRGGTHQDIKPENVIVNNKGVISGIVDFDNGYYGALLHDITTTICWYCFDDKNLNLNLFKNFIGSYQAERRLTTDEKYHFYEALRWRFLREAIIWYIYVSHRKNLAKKRAAYFMDLYTKFKIPESIIKSLL